MKRLDFGGKTSPSVGEKQTKLMPLPDSQLIGDNTLPSVYIEAGVT